MIYHLIPYHISLDIVDIIMIRVAFLTLFLSLSVEYPTASSPGHVVIRGEDGRQVAQWMLSGMSKHVCMTCAECLEHAFYVQLGPSLIQRISFGHPTSYQE